MYIYVGIYRYINEETYRPLPALKFNFLNHDIIIIKYKGISLQCSRGMPNVMPIHYEQYVV